MSRNLLGNPSGNNAIFLDVLSLLVNRIEKLDVRLTKTDMSNLTIFQEIEADHEKNRERTESILRASRYKAKDRDPISLVATRHAASTKHGLDASEFDSKIVIEEEDRSRIRGYLSEEESEGMGNKDDG